MDMLFAEIKLGQVMSTIVYGMLGFLLFLAILWIMEKLTHFSIRRQIIEEKNVSLAIVLGAFYIAIGMIISAVVG
ncbi:MAG: DUF350 domain-containing protein [Gammaproteobacteria bacterium]|nr:DUF350 domain-containing protein [Gammaproteobacteria bacterium]